jgi:hypothetical protein
MTKPKLVERPTCANCGKRYGNRDTEIVSVQWNPDNETEPAPKTNYPIIRTRSWTINEPGDRFYQRRKHCFVLKSDRIMGGYPPFCTLRCALAYGRKAYEKSKRGGA